VNWGVYLHPSNTCSSRVQASDGCFFERLSGSLLENTAGHGELNERGESREVDDAEPAMRIVGLSVEDHQQFKDLYLEALYTIMHRVGGIASDLCSIW